MMEYYARQIALPEVGTKGQEKLRKGKCLVVGAGGLGCSALTYLATAGVGTLGICDGDEIAIHNLHRQILYTVADLNTQKAQSAVKRLGTINPYIQLKAHPVRINPSNAPEIISQYDLILDCSDNFQTKFLLNDASYLLKVPLVRASIHRFEGQIQFYTPDGSPCLRCLWPETPADNCIETCAETGVIGIVPGFFGILQASEAIKYLLGLPTLSSEALLTYHLLTHEQKRLWIEKEPDCPLCGLHPTLTQLSTHEPWELRVHDINLNQFQLVDIREPDEVSRLPMQQHPFLHFPLSRFHAQLDPEVQYLFFCARGRRSHQLVKALRQEGWMNVYSLIGGINALS